MQAKTERIAIEACLSEYNIQSEAGCGLKCGHHL